MKKMALAAMIAASLSAAPAFAGGEASQANDPFVSTQGEFNLGGLGGVLVPLITITVLVAAASGT